MKKLLFLILQANLCLGMFAPMEYAKTQSVQPQFTIAYLSLTSSYLTVQENAFKYVHEISLHSCTRGMHYFEVKMRKLCVNGSAYLRTIRDAIQSTIDKLGSRNTQRPVMDRHKEIIGMVLSEPDMQRIDAYLEVQALVQHGKASEAFERAGMYQSLYGDCDSAHALRQLVSDHGHALSAPNIAPDVRHLFVADKDAKIGEPLLDVPVYIPEKYAARLVSGSESSFASISHSPIVISKPERSQSRRVQDRISEVIRQNRAVIKKTDTQTPLIIKQEKGTNKLYVKINGKNYYADKNSQIKLNNGVVGVVKGQHIYLVPVGDFLIDDMDNCHVSIAPNTLVCLNKPGQHIRWPDGSIWIYQDKTVYTVALGKSLVNKSEAIAYLNMPGMVYCMADGEAFNGQATGTHYVYIARDEVVYPIPVESGFIITNDGTAYFALDGAIALLKNGEHIFGKDGMHYSFSQDKIYIIRPEEIGKEEPFDSSSIQKTTDMIATTPTKVVDIHPEVDKRIEDALNALKIEDKDFDQHMKAVDEVLNHLKEQGLLNPPDDGVLTPEMRDAIVHGIKHFIKEFKPENH